jgi:hypothetical protein
MTHNGEDLQRYLTFLSFSSDMSTEPIEERFKIVPVSDQPIYESDAVHESVSDCIRGPSGSQEEQREE